MEEILEIKGDYLFKDLKVDNPVDTAHRVREMLKLDPIQPVFDLPAEIEKAGIKLYLSAFGFKKTFGLSVSDQDLGPAIVVNSEEEISVERRIFTIAMNWDIYSCIPAATMTRNQ